MRLNTLKTRIAQGETVYGVFLPVWSPAMVEILGHTGFDFVIIDAEHGPMAPEGCEHMVRAAECAAIAPLVRIAVNQRQNILRYLDTGVLGAMLPQLNTAEEVAQAVQAVKYPPVGQRGLAGVRAADFGLKEPLSDYITTANQQTMIVIQVETAQAVDNIDAILAVPATDVVFIGPTDLSAALGYPGQTQHPHVQQTIERLTAKIHAAGKTAGTVAYDAGTLARRKSQGFRFIVHNLIPLLAKAGRDYLALARAPGDR